MNRIIKILIIVLTPLTLLGQEINSKQLETKNSLYYIKGEESPYTGTAITYSKENKKQSSMEYISGLPNGTLTAWYPDGSKQVEGKIIGASKVEKWIAWYQNGNKIREGEYKNNREEGLFTWWFENGKINKKGYYENGVGTGEWVWYYENGNLKQVGSIKGEANLGKWKDYYENGNPKNEGEFRNGKMDGNWITWNSKGEKTIKEYKNGLLLSDIPDKNSYIKKMNYFLGERDFKNSLLNIQKAIETINEKNHSNAEYMTLIALYSKVYSLFNHLDEAERIILIATGIPEKEVEIIIESISKESHFKLQKVAKSIAKSKIAKTNIAPHIALSLIYNILGDSISLRKEQQFMMERSNTSDWVINNSLAIYGIRASKEEGNGIVNEILKEIKTEGENYKNQLQLTFYLSTIGRFEEAEKITNKYLSLNSKDVEFLRMKLNLEMSKGNTKQMKKIKEKILKINPKAFKE